MKYMGKRNYEPAKSHGLLTTRWRVWARGKQIIASGRQRWVKQLSCFAGHRINIMPMCYVSFYTAAGRPASRLSTHQFSAKNLSNDEQRLLPGVRWRFNFCKTITIILLFVVDVRSAKKRRTPTADELLTRHDGEQVITTSQLLNRKQLEHKHNSFSKTNGRHGICEQACRRGPREFFTAVRPTRWQRQL